MINCHYCHDERSMGSKNIQARDAVCFIGRFLVRTFVLVYWLLVKSMALITTVDVCTPFHRYLPNESQCDILVRCFTSTQVPEWSLCPSRARPWTLICLLIRCCLIWLLEFVECFCNLFGKSNCMKFADWRTICPRPSWHSSSIWQNNVFQTCICRNLQLKKIDVAARLHLNCSFAVFLAWIVQKNSLTDSRIYLILLFRLRLTLQATKTFRFWFFRNPDLAFLLLCLFGFGEYDWVDIG